MRKCTLYLLLVFLPSLLLAQHEHHAEFTKATGIAPQPLASQAMRLQEALNFAGSALSEPDSRRLKILLDRKPDEQTVEGIQEILDTYCLNVVHINPEGRVKVDRGLAKPALVQGGWSVFLVKVINEAGITAKLEVESPNAAKPYHSPAFEHRVKKEHELSPGQVANRFLEVQMYTSRPLQPNLSGLKLEYAVVQVYSKEAGQREAEIAYNVGQGSQDLGFRNAVHILFDVKPSVKVKFKIRDTDGKPAMASFLISDEKLQTVGKFKKYYPLPSRRVAAFDEYPDFFFQPQVYRNDGEHVLLPAGNYAVTYSRGPEYLPQTKVISVPAGKDSIEASFDLKRWIQLAKLGWYSADHHIHAAGCSHYDSPTEGVDPADMFRQALGEDLNMAANLAWGPSWYHQKTFFTGKDHPLSRKSNVMRNDVEVSGFPSSHAGHIVLLKVKEDDYPNTKVIEDWPSWTAPVLSWAKKQGSIVGYAHSGWGLEPLTAVNKLPNYVTPKMDGIGANEYIATVTQNLVDFYSAGDTPALWELNMYYHTLNCGFRPRLSGETDFPCITDARVGQARSYFKPEGEMTYDSYIEAIRRGRSYVSDGKSHILDFTVNGQEAGVGESEIALKKQQNTSISAKIAAYLPAEQDSIGAKTARSPLSSMPFWDIERARIGKSRNVKVELIVNGEVADSAIVAADGTMRDVKFTYHPEHSAWLALRIFPSSHSNPVFVKVEGKPISVKKSAEWCINALEQCWKMKAPAIRPGEKKEAEELYQKAKTAYQQIAASAEK